jgi:hypothetical protein
MNEKYCKLSSCGIRIGSDRHGNAETCCQEHALLLKKEREQANYYLLRNTSFLILEVNRILRLLAKEFGYGVAIPAEEFLKYNFQWDVITENFEKDGVAGVAVGDHAYILFKEHQIKIYKND